LLRAIITCIIISYRGEDLKKNEFYKTLEEDDTGVGSSCIVRVVREACVK
jgi:hypothetical protein